jgi:signal transduction histidine kinase
VEDPTSAGGVGRNPVCGRDLEIEVAARCGAKDGLFAAKQAAEESSRAGTALLANIGHELLTPLNAILGYGEMLKEQAVEAGNLDCAADLAKIVSSGQHLLALINDVLDLAKIDAGGVSVCVEPVPVSAVAEEVAEIIEPLAKKNGNTFVLHRESTGGIMHVDLGKFRQSLLNLLSNACKFTERGTVALRITRETSEGKEWINWQVSDTGIGISAGDTEKLFQSFTPLDASATRRHGGPGLGLAISQKFCQMMGGRITVQSELGKGSTFTIRMPAEGLGTPANEDTGEMPRHA